MIDLEQEQEELAKADADIADGEDRLARQEELVTQLHLDGHDTTPAKELLEALRRTLEEWRSRRAQIVAVIEQAERQAEAERRS
jgi:hypothetical protein